MPREVIVPPPDPPVIVEDDKYTTRAPSNDREHLCKALVYLSEKVYDALEIDQQGNNRYARRLRLINHKYDDARKLIREREFEVGLPIEASAWNDLDQEYLKVCLLSTVVKVDTSYNWFKLKVEFNQFISHQTKLLMDKMDEEAEIVPEPARKAGNSPINDAARAPDPKETSRPSTSFANSKPDVNLNELRNRQSVHTKTPETNARINQHKTEIATGASDKVKEEKPSFGKPPPVIETISIDEDDDISVVCIKPATKGKTCNR